MTDDPNAAIRAGGSADPDQPGPGAGVAAAATTLTGAAQSAANDTIDGLQQFGNHVFDVGESGLRDALKVVDAAQTGISNITSIVTAKITGGEAVDLPTIPTGDIAGGLTDAAQSGANRLLNGLQTLTNEAYDFGEEALEDALKLVDEAQRELSALHSKVTNLLVGKLGPAKG
jgi:hypothetical protein